MRAFPQGEPTRKRFIGEAIAYVYLRVNARHSTWLTECRWSSKYGEFPAGDPELHHVAGTLYAEGERRYRTDADSKLMRLVEDDTYDAERHLILGTKDSPAILAQMEFEWYTEDEPSTAPLYAARAVLPYLLTGNVRAANQTLLLFSSRLGQSKQNLGVQEVTSKSSDLRVYPSLPLLNFLHLLLLAIQRGSPDLFRQLKSHYAVHLKDVGTWDEAMAQIGEMYFGIKIPQQHNPLFDMMGSLLMGGGGGGGGGGQSGRRTPRTVGVQAPAPPPGPD